MYKLAKKRKLETDIQKDNNQNNEKKWMKIFQKGHMFGVKEPWCNNQGVVILPYVIKNNAYYYLLVKEYNPLFLNNQISEYSSITGGLENLDPYVTVINEMKEEVGININENNKNIKIYYLGKHYANKSSTKLWYYFAIDLSKLDLDLDLTYKGGTDGSVGEENISGKFISQEQLKKCNDSLGLAVYGKLKLKKEKINKLEEEEIDDFVEQYLNECRYLSLASNWTYNIDKNEWDKWNNDLTEQLKRLDESKLISPELIEQLKIDSKNYKYNEQTSLTKDQNDESVTYIINLINNLKITDEHISNVSNSSQKI